MYITALVVTTKFSKAHKLLFFIRGMVKPIMIHSHHGIVREMWELQPHTLAMMNFKNSVEALLW